MARSVHHHYYITCRTYRSRTDTTSIYDTHGARYQRIGMQCSDRAKHAGSSLLRLHMMHTGVRTCAGIGSYPRRVRLAGVAACDADEPGDDDAVDGASAAKSSFDAGMLSTAASGATVR